MKILFDNHTPFMLAPGGAQVQVEQTKAALEQLGVTVEPLRWWDSKQTGDVLHQFGFLPPNVARLAKEQGWRVVVTPILSEQSNRAGTGLWLRKLLLRGAMAAPLPGGLKERLPGVVFREYERIVVGLEAEARFVEQVYGIARRAIAVVPLGTGETFLKAGPGPRTADYLISHGRIGAIKGSLELARLAQAAQVPVLFVGKPPENAAAYWQEFQALVDGKSVRHREHVGALPDMARLLQGARGYVLTSRFENWCLAAHEAAACGLPLLLPDKPWARERFGSQAWYFPKGSPSAAAETLRRFYEESPRLPAPQVRLYSWQEVAQQLKTLYEELLNRG